MYPPRCQTVGFQTAYILSGFVQRLLWVKTRSLIRAATETLKEEQTLDGTYRGTKYLPIFRSLEENVSA